MRCCGRGITLASDQLQRIDVPRLLWTRLISALRSRGQGKRESGAFLLGRQQGAAGKVARFACYDDLDTHAYQGGAIEFHSDGYAELWRLCRENKLVLLADVHTHPGGDVRQSGMDRRHPMVAVIGHTALIVPHFAATSRWSLREVGVYEYLGGYQWRTHVPQGSLPRARLTWW